MPSFHELFLTHCASKGMFAVSRLPLADHCTFYYQESNPTEIYDLNALNGKQGFLFAPFIASKEHPILLMEKAEVTRCGLELSASLNDLKLSEVSNIADHYLYTFNTFHTALKEKLFQKLVLARSVKVEVCEFDLEQLFLTACQLYPCQHIALVSSPQSGTWLMATPEILLEKQQGELWQTMALAGTMHKTEAEQEWSEKNKQEHEDVSTYILNCLAKYADTINVSDPYTTVAANLAHLRTDISFIPRDEQRIGDLLADLHPTPAVCGIPKEKAKEFIIANEGMDRSYYSGFVGSLNMGGETHLYVSLRCMQIMKNSCRLYAGGGLLAESCVESEWKETEAKLQTMRKLLL